MTNEPYLHKWLNVISLRIVFTFESKEEMCCCRSIKSLTARLDKSNWCLSFSVWCKPFNIAIVVIVAKFPIYISLIPIKCFLLLCLQRRMCFSVLPLLSLLFALSLLLLVVSRFLYVTSSSSLLPVAREPSSNAFATFQFALRDEILEGVTLSFSSFCV